MSNCYPVVRLLPTAAAAANKDNTTAAAATTTTTTTTTTAVLLLIMLHYHYTHASIEQLLKIALQFISAVNPMWLMLSGFYNNFTCYIRLGKLRYSKAIILDSYNNNLLNFTSPKIIT